MAATVTPATGASLGGMPLPFAHIEVDGIVTALKVIEFPGVDGVAGLNMGKRTRRIAITGYLKDAIGGSPKGADIENLDQGGLAPLVTGIGNRTFTFCRVISSKTFDWAKTAGDGGELQSCRYSIELEQMKFQAAVTV